MARDGPDRARNAIDDSGRTRFRRSSRRRLPPTARSSPCSPTPAFVFGSSGKAGTIRVREQLTERTRERDPILKTRAGRRDVLLIPSVGRLLLEHKMASRFKAADDPVFVASDGRPMRQLTVAQGGLEAALKATGIEDVTLHDLPHVFVAMLVAGGADPSFVAARAGHANVAMTLNVYSYLWDAQTRVAEAAERLEATFARQAASPVAIP